LDEEDAAMEVGRAMDALKKDRESLAKKERLMDQSLKVLLFIYFQPKLQLSTSCLPTAMSSDQLLEDFTGSCMRCDTSSMRGVDTQAHHEHHDAQHLSFLRITDLLITEMVLDMMMTRMVGLMVQAINDEALAFQREKQARLNQVEVVLLLRLHQIEYLQDGQLPSDLSGALLFSNTELDKLKCRVHVSPCSYYPPPILSLHPLPL